MYADSTSAITEMITSAETSVLANDRALYNSFFQCAIDNAARLGLVFGGTIGVQMLTGKKPHIGPTISLTTWEIYCENTYATCREHVYYRGKDKH